MHGDSRATPPAPAAADARWQARGAGERYRDRRFATRRARERDPALLGALLARLALAPGAPVLDVPCGAGRLRATLEGAGLAYWGADVSAAMLGAIGGGGRILHADARALPFPDASFELVACCRLLHHVRDDGELEALLAELLRVSRRWLVASFWDAGSLAAWRERAGLRRRRHPEGRVARSRAAIARRVERAGGEIVAFRHSFRFVSQQTFFLARRALRADGSHACRS